MTFSIKISYLSSKGRAAIVCFPGIFYRGGAEQKIRKYLKVGSSLPIHFTE
jgi:type I restriction-modification system DNA methylase subunit